MSRSVLQPSQQKLAEKLTILNDRGVGMLTRLYNIKKVRGAPAERGVDGEPPRRDPRRRSGWRSAGLAAVPAAPRPSGGAREAGREPRRRRPAREGGAGALVRPPHRYRERRMKEWRRPGRSWRRPQQRGLVPAQPPEPLPCVTHTSREWAAPRGFSHAKTWRCRAEKGVWGKISKFNFDKFESRGCLAALGVRWSGSLELRCVLEQLLGSRRKWIGVGLGEVARRCRKL